MIVCKFGGSSTVNLTALANIKKISKNKNRKILVFSAFGKPFFDDKKLTDILFEKNIEKTKIYLNYLCKLTKIKININMLIDSIYKTFSKNNSIEYLVSRGEYLTCLIMSKYLNIKFIPAEKIIFFDKLNLNYKKINNKIKYYLKKYHQIVVPGFYGINEQGDIKLLSRGGGDVTGAVLAKCTKANVYENYTDTSGIKMVNPSIIKNAKTIQKISYTDAMVMTNCDAKVLHQDVCNILENTNTKTIVKNIYKPNSLSTSIDNHKHSCQFVCFKQVCDYVQIVAKTNSVDCLKKFYDQINYLSFNYVYFCSSGDSYQKLIKGIYKAIEK